MSYAYVASRILFHYVAVFFLYSLCSTVGEGALLLLNPPAPFRCSIALNFDLGLLLMFPCLTTWFSENWGVRISDGYPAIYFLTT